MAMPCTKQDRATAIISHILELDHKIGLPVPAKLSGGLRMGRLIQQAGWVARIDPEIRIALSRGYENVVEELYLPERGCKVFELKIFGRARLVANLKGKSIELHAFLPGVWERQFGADPEGDTIPLEQWVFARPGTAVWAEYEKSDVFKRRPRRASPPPPEGPYEIFS
jgi:hypothetical protein